MKWLLAVGNNPLVLALSSMFGALAVSYLQATALEAFYWLIPTIFLIVADLIAGVSAAKYRGENIRFSRAARRTINKFFCYGCWVICCVAMNERYHTVLCAWLGIGVVLGIEGTSFLTNLLEPHGLKLSWQAVLKVVGKKLKIESLEEVIEKDEKK